MKKLLFVSVIALSFVGLAVASSLSVPFFLDNGSTGQIVPETGTASFIGLKNNTAAGITVTVTYRSNEGQDLTPAENTFVLGSYVGTGYRPAVDDAASEGAGSEIPDMVTTGGIQWGSALYQWAGSPYDIQGRLVIYSSQSGAAAFLLPQGFSN
jgi:hypothetical protein